MKLTDGKHLTGELWSLTVAAPALSCKFTDTHMLGQALSSSGFVLKFVKHAHREIHRDILTETHSKRCSEEHGETQRDTQRKPRLKEGTG